MKLTLKQIAIFGQVKVNLKSVDSNSIICSTLLDLYKAGWWVTDRFGTIITIVKPKQYTKDGFACVCRRIYTDVNLDTLDVLTKQIADVQYEQYKNMLKSKQIQDKIKKSKEQYNANQMSALQSNNKTKHDDILFKAQNGTIGKISRTKKKS